MQDTQTQTQRLDKWLWAARWYKTRALATQACERGRVRVNGQAAKPAKTVRAGDMLELAHERGQFTVEVLALDPQRKSASLAQALYQETDASRMARDQAAELRRLGPEPESSRHGRPTKRDRRLIDHIRGG